MGIFLTLAFLFFIGSVFGWLLELVYRNSVDKSHGLINPGFCTGPYVPLYGFGLCVLYLLASVEKYDILPSPWDKIVLFFFMAVCMTLIEYIAGIFSLKVLKVRLWDYSKRPGNIQGIICPEFSLAWALLSAVYYFLIHPYILDALDWLSRNLAFSFVVGMFFGVFIIDFAHSADIVSKLHKFAADNEIVLKYESVKAHIKQKQSESAERYRFFRPFRTELPLSEHLKMMYEEEKARIEKRYKKQ